ncbi:DUF6346 domain-containing protein [Actinoplanes sp. CA-054009]
MADEPDRMREIRERFEELKRETAPEPRLEPPAATVSPVDRPDRGKLRGYLRFAALLLGLIVMFQTAFTLLSYNGNDFDDARRIGQATVESCERRGPIGLIYGYWDECLVSVAWDNGVHQRSYFDKPHLFEAGEVGTTVQIGENGYGRSGFRYSRPDFEPQPLLATLGVILFIAAAIPAAIVIWILWLAARAMIRKAFRRR